MHWETLSSVEQLQELIQRKTTFVVFKHSTRCSVSSMAKRSIEFDFDLLPPDFPIYYLDLIAYRPVSTFIAEHWKIRHESPQLLVLQGDQCLYHASHGDIEIKDILPLV